MGIMLGSAFAVERFIQNFVDCSAAARRADQFRRQSDNVAEIRGHEFAAA
jgi:hypothetical protein